MHRFAIPSHERSRQLDGSLGSLLSAFLIAVLSTTFGTARLCSQVSPPHFLTTEAPNATRSPIGLSAFTASRTLQIHEDVGRSVRPIQALMFRRDGVSRDTYQPFNVIVSVVMSIGGTSAAAPDPDFANNHGANPVTVVATRLVAFPASAPTDTLPAPFEYVIPFDVPFAYSPFAAAGPLVWDMIATGLAATNDAPQLDSASSFNIGNPLPAQTTYGAGCFASGATAPMSVRLGAIQDWPNNSMSFELGASAAPNNALAVSLLGLSNVGQFELPGTALGSSGSCSLLVDIVANVPLTTGSTGIALGTLSFTVDPSMHGTSFFNQVAAVDLGANPLGVITSNAAARQLIAPFAAPQVGRVQAIGDIGPTGTVQTGITTVVRFSR